MPTPFPTQIAGARFLSSRKYALLADQPRCGKTGTAIMAADDCMDETVLTITTASGIPVWNRAWRQWSPFKREAQIVSSGSFKLDAKKPLAMVSWNMLANAGVRAELMKRRWDRIIPDEAHKAKNFATIATQALYGQIIEDGAKLLVSTALFDKGRGVWPLTGTPLPHDPSDIYPMMRALFPERLAADPAQGWPDVTRFEDFRNRYCKWRPKRLSTWRTIIVIMGGKNEDELRARLEGVILRRTQQDVGIHAPIYETLPLAVSAKMLRQVEGDVDRAKVLAAAKSGETRDLDMHLGPLRRMTGEIKARAVVDAVHEEFANGLDKIVLAYWHRDVGQILKDGLAKFGVTGIDGSTKDRSGPERAFLDPKGPRVFLAQIEAAGEAIDLSSAAELWFVESVFQPKGMAQMAMRITNFTQTRQCFVRVCVLENSIDEAINESLMRLWTTIREVLK